jgi:hypothetical protein
MAHPDSAIYGWPLRRVLRFCLQPGFGKKKVCRSAGLFFVHFCMASLGGDLTTCSRLTGSLSKHIKDEARGARTCFTLFRTLLSSLGRNLIRDLNGWVVIEEGGELWKKSEGVFWPLLCTFTHYKYINSIMTNTLTSLQCSMCATTLLPRI